MHFAPPTIILKSEKSGLIEFCGEEPRWYICSTIRACAKRKPLLKMS